MTKYYIAIHEPISEKNEIFLFTEEENLTEFIWEIQERFSHLEMALTYQD